MKKYGKRIPLFFGGLFILIGSLLIMIPSCNYDKYVEPVYNITDTMSFTHDILPLFGANCSVSGCHVNGGISPDLSAGVAYDNLFLYELIDTSMAETSVLYERMTSTTKPMPPAGLIPPADRAKVKAWIQQGALNN